jgi:hypothetical protein
LIAIRNQIYQLEATINKLVLRINANERGLTKATTRNVVKSVVSIHDHPYIPIGSVDGGDATSF